MRPVRVFQNTHPLGVADVPDEIRADGLALGVKLGEKARAIVNAVAIQIEIVSELIGPVERVRQINRRPRIIEQVQQILTGLIQVQRGVVQRVLEVHVRGMVQPRIEAHRVDEVGGHHRVEQLGVRESQHGRHHARRETLHCRIGRHFRNLLVRVRADRAAVALAQDEKRHGQERDDGEQDQRDDKRHAALPAPRSAPLARFRARPDGPDLTMHLHW